jgi:SOS response regulatory protein OraA/RecX
MAQAPVVTGLRAIRPGQVEVELDCALWRVVPLEAVYRAGLAVGGTLERAHAREVRREIRRQEALDVALRSLRHRAHTEASLEARLEQRGIAAEDSRRALDALGRAGLVDDARFAHGRAAVLAERGSGDVMIAHDLERHGLAPALVSEAIAALQAESERATAIVERRGLSSKTLRALGARGFTEASLETLVAQMDGHAIG